MFIRLDGQFHDALHRAAKDVRLYDLVQGLRDHLDRYRVMIFRLTNLNLSIKDHKEIVSLMKTKNARQIEKLISVRHTNRGKNVIKKKIRRGRKARNAICGQGGLARFNCRAAKGDVNGFGNSR